MWNDIKQQQLNELLQQAQDGILTEEDRSILDQLLHELEQVEWEALRPAVERYQQEQERLQVTYEPEQQQNTLLSALSERQEDLLRRAKAELASLLSEHEALKIEYERVTGQPLLGPST